MVSGHFKQPLCWWVGLCFHNIGCLAWGISTLKLVGSWVGPGLWCQNGDLQESSYWWIFPVASVTSVPAPSNEPQITPLFPGDSQVWLSLLWSHSFTLAPSTHETLCVPSNNRVIVSPVLQSSCTQAPVAFKTKCFGGSSFSCQTPSVGSLTGHSEISYKRTSMIQLFFNLWVAHQEGMGFDCIPRVPLLSSCHGFYVLGCRIFFFFGSFQLLLSMIVHQLIVSTFMRRDDLKFFYSTILSPP